tara:strand:- start:78517 stop:79653 length:1137 start_codon:yes stop_codon:yes gene_type:complete
MKVMIVVTHLLGTGHLARALTLARAYQAAGHHVRVASGGMPAPHLDRGDVSMVQLPPLRSDGVDFTRLLNTSGELADAAYMGQRQAQLLAMLTDPPEVLITELFPFGRRILRDEFTALLDAARALPRRPLVCASIRDILAPPSKPAKAALAETLIARHYDAVLVHADAAVTPLDLSWPVTPQLAEKLHYTGFVAAPPSGPHPQGVGRDEIIVSAGGGDVGAALFEAAIAAATMDTTRRWRLLLGGADAAQRANERGAQAPENMMIEPARPDFRQMLYGASVSVSLCGYNTALDVLQSGCRAVFVPYDAGNEVEQGIRADALAKQPDITVLRNADLTSETLLGAVDQVQRAPARVAMQRGWDGAARTVEVTTELRERMA